MQYYTRCIEFDPQIMPGESEKANGNNLAPAQLPKKAFDVPSPLRLHIGASDCQLFGKTPCAARKILAGAHAGTG